ncbi:MAG: hypothetical protein M3R52_08295 [Acidobacteriota bacterium]|nr:hypothetical protein [Acidobacteriota bacterium]
MHAVFFAHILMLMAIIFISLGEPNRSKATLEKRPVIAAAQITIAAIDHHDTHAGYVTPCGFFDEPR